MVKRTKSHRITKRRRQHGGAWYNPGSWFQETSGENTGGIGNFFSSGIDALKTGVSSAEQGLTNIGNSASETLSGAKKSFGESVANVGDKLSGNASTNVEPDMQTQQDMQAQNVNLQAQDVNLQAQDANLQAQDANLQAQDANQQAIGGRRRKMKGVMKGGKADLSYYAAPVHGLKVAEPKYWISGGTKRKSKKSRKSRKARRGRKSRKC
jgi:hypothetical protein